MLTAERNFLLIVLFVVIFAVMFVLDAQQAPASPAHARARSTSKVVSQVIPRFPVWMNAGEYIKH